MKLDKFIKRPVLSTVISIVMVILGFIGLISLPIEQYPNIAPPTMVRPLSPCSLSKAWTPTCVR